jgi:zinc and cadmium transporter
MLPMLFSLIATLTISLVSLLGVFFVFLNPKSLSKLTLFFVSFAIGGLLGDSFIHLIPQSFGFFKSSSTTSLLILVGILIFFILEKFLLWHHCHEADCHQSTKHIATLNLVGDSIHNLIDGALIAASFQVSLFVGLSTSLAVILHEIPQEIGDFGILIHHQISVKKALIYNFLSALFSIFGVLIVFIFDPNFSNSLIPITAGGFIYLAATDLIPELHRHDTKINNSLIQLICILLGIGLMFMMTFLE